MAVEVLPLDTAPRNEVLTWLNPGVVRPIADGVTTIANPLVPIAVPSLAW